MKLRTAEARKIVVGGKQATNTFSIKATAKAFNILSSGLYADKILAIVRELACNAYDSHVLAGKQNTPIEIHLPTYLEPVFSVTDYGVGLDDDGVMQLYTTYFESTKIDSDDFTGQLGLGSKSPFSYTQSFNIESRFNGVKRIYTAFINEEGMPAITRMSEIEFDAPNGLTVSVVVRTSDINKFMESARKALMYFAPVPVFTGARIQPYNLVHNPVGNGEDWKLRSTDYGAYMRGPYIIQGRVAYPVDMYILEQNGLPHDIAEALRTINVDMFVPIGTVEVAASRESLSYDKRTIANIVQHINEVVVQMKDALQENIDKCSSLWNAYVAYNQALSNSGIARLISKASGDPLSWNGQDLSIDLTLSPVSANCQLMVAKKKHLRGRDRLHAYEVEESIKFRPNDTTHVYYTASRQWKKAIAQIIPDGSNDVAFIVIAENKNNLGVARADATVMANTQMGGAPVEELMSVATASTTNGRKQYSYRAKKLDEALVWVGFSTKTDRRGRAHTVHAFSRNTWNTANVDLRNGTGFYVPVKRFTPFIDRVDSAEALNIGRVIINAKNAGILPLVSVYGFNEKQISVLGSGWKNLYEYLDAAVLPKVDQWRAAYTIATAITALNPHVVKCFIDNWNTTKTSFVDGPFKKFFDEIATTVNMSKTMFTNVFTHQSAEDLSRDICKKSFYTDGSEAKAALGERWTNLLELYPMLCRISWTSMLSYDIDGKQVLIDYVNLVDKNRSGNN